MLSHNLNFEKLAARMLVPICQIIFVRNLIGQTHIAALANDFTI